MASYTTNFMVAMLFIRKPIILLLLIPIKNYSFSSLEVSVESIHNQVTRLYLTTEKFHSFKTP